mmetsp:Transcript_11284/g.39323  ORF Transcript_11284/g.39323 Transcript_11284/m.39323 type:complete len:358 (-) Transcript_11284:890-1963(-)
MCGASTLMLLKNATWRSPSMMAKLSRSRRKSMQPLPSSGGTSAQASAVLSARHNFLRLENQKSYLRFLACLLVGDATKLDRVAKLTASATAAAFSSSDIGAASTEMGRHCSRYNFPSSLDTAHSTSMGCPCSVSSAATCAASSHACASVSFRARRSEMGMSTSISPSAPRVPESSALAWPAVGSSVPSPPAPPAPPVRRRPLPPVDRERLARAGASTLPSLPSVPLRPPPADGPAGGAMAMKRCSASRTPSTLQAAADEAIDAAALMLCGRKSGGGLATMTCSGMTRPPTAVVPRPCTASIKTTSALVTGWRLNATPLTAGCTIFCTTHPIGRSSGSSPAAPPSPPLPSAPALRPAA